MRSEILGCTGAAAALLSATLLAQVQPAPPDAPRAAVRAQAQPDTAGFYRASEVIGTSVRGQGGENMGQIQDLLIDGRTQQIQYFILSSGRTVDAQSKLHVMPWAVAEPQFRSREERHFTVQVPPARLREAPAYSQEQIFGGTQWTNEVNRFYNVPQRQRVLRPNFEGEAEIERGDRELKIEREDGKVEIERDND